MNVLIITGVLCLCVCMCVCLNSCNSTQQNSLVQMTLDLLFNVVAVAVEYNATVFFTSLSHIFIVVTTR